MQIMLTDETNKEPSKKSRFFVYGGLIFPSEQIGPIDDGINSIRTKYGYQPGDKLKFDTNSRPDNVTIENAKEAKKDVINLCSKLGCVFIVHIILHDIIKNQDFNNHVMWAADYVIGRFNQYLTIQISDFGICIMDNLPKGSEFSYLTKKFQFGLTLPGNSQVPLDKIKLFASTCIGASNLSSAMDIVLGSFRYVLNDRHNLENNKEMLKKIVSMMWAKKEDGKILLKDRGMIIRPPRQEIKIEKFKKEYEDLVNYLTDLVN